jgi:hypothetical protein
MVSHNYAIFFPIVFLTESTVRTQIHIAIISYCLVSIIEKELKLERPT